ncbi:hypothetical protein BMIN10S_01656 [Bosea minatitlanensis]
MELLRYFDIATAIRVALALCFAMMLAVVLGLL